MLDWYAWHTAYYEDTISQVGVLHTVWETNKYSHAQPKLSTQVTKRITNKRPYKHLLAMEDLTH